jgi:hypothetical protein
MNYYIIKNFKISIYDNSKPIQKAAELLKIKLEDLIDFKILRRSLDLRHKDKDIYTVYTAIFALKCPRPDSKLLEAYEPVKNDKNRVFTGTALQARPVIVGCGPAGLFCAMTFLENGIAPIIVERGARITQRIQDIKHFQKNRVVNPQSNVCFGEGGAGTFSDGKLTSRSKDIRHNKVLKTFVKYGADESILYDHRPHVGTDILRRVITNMTDDLVCRGAEFYFNTCFENADIKNGAVRAVQCADLEIKTNVLLLSTGHSARDTYEMMYEKGLAMEPKPFAVGVRVEHLRRDIDRATYQKHYLQASLPAAEYILKYKDSSGRGIYTFCNCPGGEVIACITQKEMLCINGMSYSKRDAVNSNSAVVITVNQKDFNSAMPLAGIEFQRKLEHQAYVLGGENYNAPVMSLGDFLSHTDSKGFGKVTPSYLPGIRKADLHDCLPQSITEPLKRAIMDFGCKLKGFDSANAYITAAESRTSSPVRLLRNKNCESINVKGLFVAGEGSGYAGGIVSSAIDGIKAAEGCMETLLNK